MPGTTIRGEADAYRLGRRRVYILPTRPGLGFGLTLAVMLVGAVNYNNSLAFALTFTLGAMALVSTLYTNRNLMALTVRAGEAEPVFAGELAEPAVYIDNREGPAREDVSVRYRVPGEAADRAVSVDVPAREIVRVPLPSRATARGWLELERLQLASRYPFGLFRAWSWPKIRVRALVYPRPQGSEALPLRADDYRGEVMGSGPGREDFAGLREYRPGDSPRAIHWRAAARGPGELTDSLPVKVFTGSGAGEVLLDFERTGGPLEARLSQLCRWVLEADSNGLRYSLALPGENLPSERGADHRALALRLLALYDAGRRP